MPREHKPLWQLSRLNDFITEAAANLFVCNRLKIHNQSLVKHLRWSFLRKCFQAKSHSLFLQKATS